MIWITLYLLGIAFSVSGFLLDVIAYAEKYDWSDERIKTELENSIPLMMVVSLVPGLNYINAIGHCINAFWLRNNQKLRCLREKVADWGAKKIMKLIKKGDNNGSN